MKSQIRKDSSKKIIEIYIEIVAPQKRPKAETSAAARSRKARSVYIEMVMVTAGGGFD